MNIYLARHGNTFGPTDKLVWVGKKNDPPLVEKGFEQARRDADYFKTNNIHFKAVFCSPLLRTSQFAATIIDTLNLPLKFQIDKRLSEIDYGEWSGLSNEEIINRFGNAELEAWNKESEWPTSASWVGSENKTKNDIKNFVNEIIQTFNPSDNILIIGSNGILRYFLSLIPDEFEQRIKDQSFKMSTGAISKLHVDNKRLSVDFWNKTVE